MIDSETFMIAIDIFVIVITIAFIAFCVGYSTAKHKYRKISSNDIVKIAEKRLDLELMKFKNKSLKQIIKDRKKMEIYKDMARTNEDSIPVIRNKFEGEK